ncbi:hypothetical protein RSOL_014550, partial [Rhizoctonia solani AG-3 Rhs1AP]
MTDQHRDKKRKRSQPTAPPMSLSKSMSADSSDRSRAGSVSDVEREHDQFRGKYNGIIVRSNLPKKKDKKTILQTTLNVASSRSSKHTPGTASKGKGKATLTFGSDSDEVVQGLSSNNGSGNGLDEEEKEGSASDTSPPRKNKISRTSSRHEDAIAGPSTRKPSKVKVKKGGQAIPMLNMVGLRACVLKGMLSLTGLKYAHDAANVIPQFDEEGQPRHFIDNVLTLHFDRTFKDEWRIWGAPLIKIMRDSSRWDPAEQDILCVATDSNIREAVRIGVWSSMKKSYEGSKKESKEVWLNARRSTARIAWHKGQKAERRLNALKSSNLHVESYKFVGDPAFQSEEEDHPSIEKHRIVQVPEFRTDECNNLLESLDFAYNGGKQKGAGHTYTKVNVEVPYLVSGFVPQWVVSKAWQEAHPELEHKSRSRINPKEDEVPDIEEFLEFTHQFEPIEQLKRTYKDTPLVTAAEEDFEPDTTNYTTANTAHVAGPLSTEGASTSAPITTTTLGSVVVESPTPMSTSAGPDPKPPPGLPPAPPFPYTTNGPQPILVQVGDQHIWMQPVFPQSGYPPPTQGTRMYAQGGNQNVGPQFPLDPNLANQSIQLHQHSDMPPPPEIATLPEQSQDQTTPPGKGKNGRGKGKPRGKGSRGGGRGRPRKSKAAFEEPKVRVDREAEDEVEEEAEEEEQLRRPVNTRNAKRVRIKVRGS